MLSYMLRVGSVQEQLVELTCCTKQGRHPLGDAPVRICIGCYELPRDPNLHTCARSPTAVIRSPCPIAAAHHVGDDNCCKHDQTKQPPQPAHVVGAATAGTAAAAGAV